MTGSVAEKLALNHFRVDAQSHIHIIETEVCLTRCTEQACLYICPAEVYRLEEDRIRVVYEECLECGSCRIACVHLNIEWRFPRGGYGVCHQFG